MKRNSIRISIIVFLLIGIVLSFILINEQINYNKRACFTYVSDSNIYAYEVEDFFVDGEEAVISGWFFELKSVRNKSREVNKEKQLGIVFYDLNSEIDFNIDGSGKDRKGYPLKVKRVFRNDINQYYKCEYDYSKCGFEARLDKSLIDMNNGQYMIVFKVDAEDQNGIRTNTYINKGTLQYTNPNKEVPLEVNGTDLEKIVSEGYCLVSCPEYFISVFQFEDKLYWIADKRYSFEEDKSTFIQFQMDTTQINNLPPDMTDNGNYWSNKSFTFEKNEITSMMDCGQYRVSSQVIPSEYAVYKIVTGYIVDGKWEWQGNFRPLVKLIKSKDI